MRVARRATLHVVSFGNSAASLPARSRYPVKLGYRILHVPQTAVAAVTSSFTVLRVDGSHR